MNLKGKNCEYVQILETDNKIETFFSYNFTIRTKLTILKKVFFFFNDIEFTQDFAGVILKEGIGD